MWKISSSKGNVSNILHGTSTKMEADLFSIYGKHDLDGPNSSLEYYELFITLSIAELIHRNQMAHSIIFIKHA
jgi:hypothetical protein